MKHANKNAHNQLYPIQYKIKIADPAAHTFAVSLTVQSPNPAGQVFTMPAWVPGSYMLREFAKNIHAISAVCHDQAIDLVQIDKHTWCAQPCTGPITVHYEVYAYELSVRTSYLDQHLALLNFAGICLAAQGLEEQACGIELCSPSHTDQWLVATSLNRAKQSGSSKATPDKQFGLYKAPNYDALIDHPVQLGEMSWGTYKVFGARHDVAIAGKTLSLDMPKLLRDSAAICASQIALFEPVEKYAPFLDSSDRYTFMTVAVGDGYGGLEHRASTALICKRDDLPHLFDDALSPGYQQYLGLVSHEYFHTWNVKRIKPAVFAPYELSQESYTPLLWLFEGFTAYYDDLILSRAKIITPTQYLNTLASTMTGVVRGQGRLKQSAAAASFNAWVKYYRQDEHSPNALCNYYTQGSLIAAYLDLYIRLKTDHHKSLDDVMRCLWQQFGCNFYKGQGLGVTLTDIYAAFNVSTGLNLKSLIQKLTSTAADVPLTPLLNKMGIQVHTECVHQNASLGIRTSVQGGEVKIATAYTAEAAHQAGLSGGDILIAIDGLRVTPSSLPQLLARIPAGESVRVLAWRRDELIDTMVTLDKPAQNQFRLTVKPNQKQHLTWLS